MLDSAPGLAYIEIMREARLWYVVLISLGLGGLVPAQARLPSPSASAQDLSFSLSLERTAVRPGEPLVVTTVIRNKASRPVLVPLRTLYALVGATRPVFQIRDSESRVFTHLAGARQEGWIPQFCYELAPGDSAYRIHLLWWDNFSVGLATGRDVLAPKPGCYSLLARLHVPRFTETSVTPTEWFWLADSVGFRVTADSTLARTLAPYLEFIREMFLLDARAIPPGTTDSGETRSGAVRADSFLAALDRIRTRPGPDYPYLDYLLVWAMSQVPRRRAAAIEHAQIFEHNHTGTCLAEEMAFDLWQFHYRAGKDSLADSAFRSAKARYPSNAHGLQFEPERKYWNRVRFQ